MNEQEFSDWMRRVDMALSPHLMGLGAYDMPDLMWRDWAEDGLTPQQAVEEAIDQWRMNGDWY